MTTLTLSNFWSLLFFSMLLLMGIDSIFGMYDFLIAYGWDFIPGLRNKMRKEVFVLILVIGFFLNGLLFITNNGWWWFNLFNSYACGDCLMMVLVFETCIIAVYLGFDKFDALLYARTGELTPRYLKFCILYISIPMMTGLLAYAMYAEYSYTMEPRWSHTIGRVLLFMPLVIIILGFIFPRKTPTLERLVEK
mmetsp:Transcript_24552/g.38085  ORF Transcript_24552/g.38085 Transcript_24552/m.38085 type:complete len:193 (+) Transcript_24552:1109-1687(+)